MLFTFTYIPHHIEKLQEYLDFLFFEVWAKANGDFEAEKLNGHQELKQIYIDLGNTEGDWADFFNSSIEKIYNEFLLLDTPYINDLVISYKSNNNIEGLCTNKTIVPISYDDIRVVHPTLAKELKGFYSKIYGSKSPFNLEIFGFLTKKLIGEYDYEFMTINNKEVCPFCGLHSLKGNNHSYREAYDHYIPKGVYPFSALNFKNLAPMCHECNSTYKLTKRPIYKNDEKNIDPLIREGNRNFAFYPYSNAHPEIKLSIKLKSRDVADLKPNDIELNIVANGFEEQIESWIRVFGMDERYKALLCSPSEGKAWINSIIDEFENATELSEINDAEQYYNAQLKDANKNPLSSYGFIKSQFLEECKKRGVFKTI